MMLKLLVLSSQQKKYTAECVGKNKHRHYGEGRSLFAQQTAEKIDQIALSERQVFRPKTGFRSRI